MEETKQNENRRSLKYWFNEWESDVSAITFIIIGILLTVQVISRYVFQHSITWCEEIATGLYVVMTYTGIAAAVTHRKHLTISALPDAMPYNVRKVLLIIADLVFMAFCLWLIPYFIKYIHSIAGMVLPVSRIPESTFYWPIPICMVLTAIRLVQNILRISKESEEDLGKSIPTVDLDAFERIAKAKAEADRIAAENEKGGKL